MQTQAGGSARLMSLLSTLQLSDSGFPSGRYTLSYGLEAFTQSGELPTPIGPAILATLLHDTIRFGVAPSEGIALACAHRATGPDGSPNLEALVRVDERLAAVKLAREAREASARTGRALLRTAVAFDVTSLQSYAELVESGLAPGNHAVVLGMLTAATDVPCLHAVAAELYAFSAGWVAAAVRLALIDHLTAQVLLHRVRPATAAAAQRAVAGEVSQISSCTPLLDVLSMRHEQADLRLFAS